MFTHPTRSFAIKEKNTNNHENEKWQKIITNEKSKLSKADSSFILEDFQRKMTGCILSFFLIAEKWICCYRIITCLEWCVSARWLVIYSSGMTEDANSWNQKLSFWKTNIEEKHYSKRAKKIPHRTLLNFFKMCLKSRCFWSDKEMRQGWGQ